MMLSNFLNSLFWEVVLSFLTKIKEAPMRIQQILGIAYVDLPKDIYEIYIQIATVGRNQGLDFNYFEDLAEDDPMFLELFENSPEMQEKAKDYHLASLKMLVSLIRMMKISFAWEQPLGEKSAKMPNVVDTEFSKYL